MMTIADDQRPFLTIGIPTYNRANFLKKSLISAIEQSFYDIEIIVSNNCSSDETKFFLDSISDSRVKIYHQTSKLIMIDNWNFCVEKAKGQYFLLLSDDDMLDKNFVEQCYKKCSGDLSQLFLPIIYGSCKVIDSYDSVLSFKYNNNINKIENGKKFILNWLKGNRCVQFCSTLYHTDTLMTIGGFTELNPFAADAIARGKLCINHEVAYVPEAISFYRVHETNLTYSYDLEKSLWSNIDMTNQIINEMQDEILMDEIRKAGYKYSSNSFIIESSKEIRTKASGKIVLQFYKLYLIYFGLNIGIFKDSIKLFLKVMLGDNLSKKLKTLLLRKQI